MEKNVQQTIEILEQLKNNGIDVVSAYSDITLKSGETRRRYICEIENENIEQLLEQLQIPKYLVIGKRLDQAVRYIYNDSFKQENRDAIKEKLKELGIMQYRTEIDERKTGIKDKNDKRIEMFSMLSALGIDVASFNATYSLNGKSEKVQLGMLKLDEEKIAHLKKNLMLMKALK